MEIVCKKLGCSCGSAAAIAFVRCWCMGCILETCQKKCRELRLRWGFASLFIIMYCACVIPDGKKTCGGRASSSSRDG